MQAGGVDDVLAIRVPKRAPVHVRVVSKLPLVRDSRNAVITPDDVGDVNLQEIIALAVAAINQLPAIR